MKSSKKVTEDMRRSHESIVETSKRIRELHDTITENTGETDDLGLRPKVQQEVKKGKSKLL
jgi:hypothetical protein